MYTAWSPQIAGCWVPAVHANCIHNETAALLLRSLGPTPVSVEPGRAAVGEVFRDLVRLARRYSGQKWTHLEVAQSYTGALRDRYLEAERSLREDGPVMFSDTYLRAFLKAEKVNALKKFPKPRLIYPRSPRYNLELATRLKPFEHWLWGNLKRVGNSGVPHTRVVAKGLSMQQRANLIRRKFSSIPSCVVVEVDGKAFEAHLERWVLEQEHRVYAAAFPGDGKLKRLLRYQLSMQGVTQCGVKFEREGGRASGDYNTGMGNTLVMLAVVVSVLRRMGLTTFDTLADGDNCLLFLESGSLDRVLSDFARLALDAGHEMVLERPAWDLESVRFGQSAPVDLGARGLRMVRDWRKVLSQALSSHAHLHDVRFMKRYLRGVALCEAHLSRGVPILGKWAESVLRATEGVELLPFSWYRDYQVLGVVEGAWDKPVLGESPTEEARRSFALAFGTSVCDQLDLESGLDRIEICLDSWIPVEPPTASNWWSCEPGLCEASLGG